MELIIAFLLFAGLIVSWLMLPGSTTSTVTTEVTTATTATVGQPV